jgi:hypothetical protein
MADARHPCCEPTGEITAPATVEEGGTITIGVKGDVESVSVSIPGEGVVDVPVHDGVAEYRVPPSVGPGTRVTISDNSLPEPSVAEVIVVGSSR